MSIIVKGMSVPSSCYSCPIRTGNYCGKLMEHDRVLEYVNTYTRSPYCPIEEYKEPKTGRWIPVTNGRGGYECDQCHEYAPSYKNGDEHLSNFCPNCGSYNGGEDEV